MTCGARGSAGLDLSPTTRGGLRNAVGWWRDETKQPWSLSLISTQAIARETLVAEVVASARSWRRASAVP